jgi:Bacterial membrane protein YfhO.
MEQETPEYLRMTVTADRESLLVVRETLLPGWEARINGVWARLYYADGIFRSLLIPSGEHIVELRYHTPRITWGLIVSTLSSGGLLGLILRKRNSVSKLKTVQ